MIEPARLEAAAAKLYELFAPMAEGNIYAERLDDCDAATIEAWQRDARAVLEAAVRHVGSWQPIETNPNTQPEG